MMRHQMIAVVFTWAVLAGMRLNAAPPVVLYGLGPSEQVLSAEAYRADLLVVEFWATWCGPCRPAAVHLGELYKTFKDEKFLVIGASSEPRAAISRFLETVDYPFPMAWDRNGAVQAEHGVRLLPTALVFGRDGKLLWKGNPTQIRADMIRRYLDDGTWSLAADAGGRAKAAADEPAGFRLSMTLRRATGRPGGGTAMSSGNGRFAATARNAEFASVLGMFLGVSQARLEMPASARLLEVDLELDLKTDLGRGRDDRLLLAGIMAGQFGYRVQPREWEREVLILGRGPRGLTPTEGDQGTRISATETHMTSATTQSLARQLESDLGIPVIDETGLVDRYDFSYNRDVAARGDLAELTTTLGVEFTRTVRQVSGYALTPFDGPE